MSKTKFIPQRKNANRHTQRGLRELEKSIQRDGWIGAVTVAADGETFDGSARIKPLAKPYPKRATAEVETGTDSIRDRGGAIPTVALNAND